MLHPRQLTRGRRAAEEMHWLVSVEIRLVERCHGGLVLQAGWDEKYPAPGGLNALHRFEKAAH
jgi:hypothetical protein